MIRGFWTAATGMKAQQTSLDIIANNIANVNTSGYKSIRASFADLLYSNLNNPFAENRIDTGNGTKVTKTDLKMTQAPLAATDRNLDFAITGDGFFAVVDEDGFISYTRDGSFQVSQEGVRNYLVTAQGQYVLSADLRTIQLDLSAQSAAEIQIDPSRIGVFKFDNPYGLIPVGRNTYQESETSGERSAATDAQIRPGYLESSNVELSDQMVKVIESQRSLQFNSKIIQVADEIEQVVNNLRQG